MLPVGHSPNLLLYDYFVLDQKEQDSLLILYYSSCLDRTLFDCRNSQIAVIEMANKIHLH